MSDFRCAVWQNKFLILYETSVSSCQAISSATGGCTRSSTLSYFKLGWGVFAAPINGSQVRNVHISAPHVQYDSRTGRQASYLFENANLRSLTVAGIRRDAFLSKPDNRCQSKFYASDPAHDSIVMFHQTLLATREWQLAKNGGCPHAACAFLQLHGKSSRKCPGDDVFLSMGLSTSQTKKVANSDTPISRLQAALKCVSTWSVGTPLDSSCDLRGTSNIFGRVLNGVQIGNECATSASSYKATAYFVHVEQAIGVRLEPALPTWALAIKLAFN